MIEAARLAVEFMRSMEEAEFLNDHKTRAAVLHQLLVVGEAAKRVTPEFKMRHPDVPWTLVARMRDKLIHGYDSVNLREVWHTCRFDLPDLLVKLEPLLPR